MRKGIAPIIIIGIILLAGAVGAYIAVTIFSSKLSSSLSIQITFKDKTLMEDKLYFDSEKNFLENSLLVTGSYAAYENGKNGTIYNYSWDRLEGFDLNGDWFSYVCWKDINGEKIPPENIVTGKLGERINETFQDYFSCLLDSIEITDNSLVNMEINENEFNLSYEISELNMTTEFLNHTIEERNVWITTTVPLRYLNLYKNAKDFTENSETTLNERLISMLNYTFLCTGDGRLTQDSVEEVMENVLLVDIANQLGTDYPETEWELELLRDNFEETVVGPPHHYIIEFTIKVTENESDPGRRVATNDSLEKLGIVFVINDSISFDRTVDYICGLGVPSNCGGSGSPADCSGVTCEYWANGGIANSGSVGDCDIGTDCYCQVTESCDCSNSPPDGCYNEDDNGPDIGCFECGSSGELCCDTPSCTNSGCRGVDCEPCGSCSGTNTFSCSYAGGGCNNPTCCYESGYMTCSNYDCSSLDYSECSSCPGCSWTGTGNCCCGGGSPPSPPEKCIDEKPGCMCMAPFLCNFFPMHECVGNVGDYDCSPLWCCCCPL